jgi:hypothetical protein
MGAMDPIYGAAQIGARMPEEGDLLSPNAGQADPARVATVDKTVRQREQDYQARRAAAGQTGTDWMRGLGDVATNAAMTAPLAVLGGAGPGFLTGAARGLGLGAASGAIGGATEPVTSGDFGTEKAKQIAEGAGVGAATGGVLGGLAGAIARDDPAAATQAIRDAYYRGVKPGETMTAGQVRVYDSQVRDSVDAIIDNRAGKPLPRSPEDFSNAIAETKKTLYSQYSGMAQQAEQNGARVKLQPAIDRLTKLANDPLQDPAATAEAKRLLDMVPKGTVAITPTRAEEIMGFLNERATGFDTAGTKGAGSVFREAAGALRGELVDAVEGAGFKDYGTLRRTYGSLSEIEDHVAQAAKLQRNRGAPGIGIADVAAGGVAAAGHLPSATAIEGGKFLSRWLKSPNRAIAKVFEEAQAARNSVPSSLANVKDRISSMIGRSTPSAAAGAGGAAAGP